MTMDALPTRLKKEPIHEVVWEIRFSPKSGAVELLPGQVNAYLRGKGWKLAGVTRLPIADFPKELRENDPNLRYAPTVRLDGHPISVSLGDRVVVLSCLKPYVGWTQLGAKIRELVTALISTDLIEHPERFSLKYLDFLEAHGAIDSLDMGLVIAGQSILNQPTQLRTELRQKDIIHIVEVQSPVRVADGAGKTSAPGLMLGTDSIFIASSGDTSRFWAEFSDKLDVVHEANKSLFFHLLAKRTLALLEPEYAK